MYKISKNYLSWFWKVTTFSDRWRSVKKVNRKIDLIFKVLFLLHHEERKSHRNHGSQLNHLSEKNVKIPLVFNNQQIFTFPKVKKSPPKTMTNNFLTFCICKCNIRIKFFIHRIRLKFNCTAY